MSDIREEIYLHGGLDSDSDEKFIQQGDYVDALNISQLYDGDGGLVVNTLGNKEIENTFLPAGTNKCIGRCHDNKNNAIIFFNYNSENHHGIYRYLKDSDTFQKILHDESILGFKSDCKNLQADVIDDLLYWNEGKDSSGNYINVPRKINIEKARRYTNGLTGEAYSAITEDVMSVIKRPYLGYLNCSFAYDGDYAAGHSSKFVTKDFYRFSLQLLYDDHEKSVLGSYSNICENIYYNSDNYIGIRFKYFDVDGILSKIRIYAEKNFSDSPFLIDEIDVNNPENVYDSFDDALISTALVDGNYYVYRFYGNPDGRYYDGNKNLFDNVPVYANSQTITENRLMYGDVNLSASLMGEFNEDYFTEDYVPITLRMLQSSGCMMTLDSNIIFDSTTYGFEVIIEPTMGLYVGNCVKTDATHFVHLIWEGSSTITGSTHNYESFHLKIDARKICPYWKPEKILEYIIEHSEVYVIKTDGSIVDGELLKTSATIQGIITDDGNLDGLNEQWNELTHDKANNLAYKSDSNRNFGVVFFDKYGRCLGYQLKNFNSWSSLSSSFAYKCCEHVFWGFTEFYNCSLDLYFDIENSDIKYITVVSSGNLDFIGCWQLKDADVYESSAEIIGLTYPNDYSFVEGDIVKLLNNNTTWKILSADENYIYISSDCGCSSSNVYSIEILRLKDFTSNFFHEVRTFDINEGFPPFDSFYGYLLSDGDVWLDINEEENCVYEKFYDSNGISIKSSGRIFPERIDFEQQELKHIYFSNKYFENTEINGLNTFISTNRVELSNDNGDIIALKRLGEVLYAIQRNEITSFYLGKTILKQSAGGEVVADTSQVLGGKRESAFNYGSIFPVVRMDNYIFGFDIYKGVFWMNGYNGVHVISGKDMSNNYKMDTYFKNKAKDLLSSGVSNISVHIGVDKPNERLFVSFIDLNNPDNNDTISYHLPSRRWKSRYSFIPEQYTWLDDKFYSFKDGKIYEHGLAPRCNFYDIQYNSYIQFYTHIHPNQIKIFNSIGVHSDSEWIAEPLEIEPNHNYPNGMYTKILPTEWVEEEGVYKCYIPRNMKTRSATITNYDRINGEELRGKVMKIKLTNSSIDKVQLFKVDINSEISR